MTTSPLSEATAGAGRLRALYPYLLLSLCQLIWAGNWIIGRAVREAMPPLALTFWRWGIAALFLAPIALPRIVRLGPAIRARWRVLLILGLTGAGFFQAMVYIGLRYTEAVNATMMNSAAPLFIILVASLMGIERVTARQIIGMAVSFCGILVIIDRGDIAHLRDFHFNPGDFLVLLAMPGWGLYCALLPRRPVGLNGATFVFACSAIGAIALAPFYAYESLFVRTPNFTWAALGAMLYVGLGASVISYMLWNRGVELVGPSKSGMTNHLLPAFTVLLAVLLLDESLHLFHLVGIATILAGVWLATSARTRA